MQNSRENIHSGVARYIVNCRSRLSFSPTDLFSAKFWQLENFTQVTLCQSLYLCLLILVLLLCVVLYWWVQMKLRCRRLSVMLHVWSLDFESLIEVGFMTLFHLVCRYWADKVEELQIMLKFLCYWVSSMQQIFWSLHFENALNFILS